MGHCRRPPSTCLPAGTPADGFWGRTKWSRGGFGSFARQIWLENGENFTSWILPDPGSHSDCVVSWDTVGGIQALGCLQGRPQAGYGVAQDGPVAVLAVLQGIVCWKMVESWIVPDPGCPRDLTVEPHRDCVASWDTIGGLQAIFGAQGPL